MPALWEQAVLKRYQAGESSPADESLNTLLLQLEYTLDMPSPPAFQDAQRVLKLNIMKNKMEGRDSEIGTKSDIEKMTAAAFGYARTDTAQRERLAAIIAALRSGQFEVHADKARLRSR